LKNKTISNCFIWKLFISFALSKTTKNNLAYGNPGHKITPKHINGAATLQFKREQERHDKSPFGLVCDYVARYY